MIYSKATTADALPNSVIKIIGCSETTVGFDFLEEQPKVGARRYCNKVLVHECIKVPDIAPTELDKVEFLATSDPCYKSFEIFKSSEEVDEVLPTITIQLDDDDLAIGVLVDFGTTDTCCVPPRLAYRLYGYQGTKRILLSNGNLYITPCDCLGESSPLWVDVQW